MAKRQKRKRSVFLPLLAVLLAAVWLTSVGA